MSILAGKFVTLFNSYCCVCSSEGFFLAFAASKKASFFQVKQLPKKFLNCLRRATELHNLEIVAILLANIKKSLRFYRFESAQILLIFVWFEFFLFFFILFCTEAGIFLICS